MQKYVSYTYSFPCNSTLEYKWYIVDKIATTTPVGDTTLYTINVKAIAINTRRLLDYKREMYESLALAECFLANYFTLY